jgi:cell surface protein SprA
MVIILFLTSLVWALPGYMKVFVQENNKENVSSVQHDNEVVEASENLTPPDSGLVSPIPQPINNPLQEGVFFSPFHLKTPPALQTRIYFDTITNQFVFRNMIGEVPFGPAASMDVSEFIEYDVRNEARNYWRSRGVKHSSDPNRRGGDGLIPQLRIGGDIFESIFGSNTIDVRPSGNVELLFGILHNRDDNPNLTARQQKRTEFKFDEKIQANVIAKVGDKISYNLNYNTESNFEFDNQMKLKFEGKEDDIIQLMEFGDVMLPLQSTLITGSQSLFGFKTALRFGKLTVTSVLSESKANTKSITISGGAQMQEFYLRADDYEANKHYFIAQYFRDHYNEYMSTLPLVGSPIVITRIEVWRTNIGAATAENRNIVAFTDLGEADPSFEGFHGSGYVLPSDMSNDLTVAVDTSLIRNVTTASNNLRLLGLTAGEDYEKIENARLLSPNEYTFNSKLGFISLNTTLTSDQVLAVAFQYQVIGDDAVYQVGEFSNEVSSPGAIRVKLLKSTSLNTKSPLWKLMMKNVYNLNAYQISSEKFRLNILYTGDDEGVANGFFNTGSVKGIPLIRLMGLDRLNQQQDPYPDGVFDFVDGADVNGGTIVSRNGRIYFPTVEPFGKDLRAVIPEPEVADRYAYDSLYTMTKTLAQQYTAKNKFYLEGTYQSSFGSEISLGAFNLPEGSVKVTAGGIPLVENQDYTVNYGMGTITITNEGILKSGAPIHVNLEDRNKMNDRWMMGTNLDYRVNQDLNIGATILNLRERPITNKVNYGNEPINNMIWGMNIAYKKEVPFITKLVDWLPFYSTTAKSYVQMDGEFAHFVPGHSRAVGKEGTTYIDDFESAKVSVDLGQRQFWVMASTPQGQPHWFREAMPVSSSEPARRQLAYGFNRAKLAWYIIDPLFYANTTATPPNLTKDDQSAPYARAVYEPELFPNREYSSAAQSTYMPVFNLAFFPTERGPYNYDVDGSEGFSAGVDADGSLNDPGSRWGGIMRRFDYTDFESNNYEYIEFWMMDPFIENPNHKGGKLVFNLGDISEDILRDGKKFFENGLPGDGSDEDVEYTVWGRVPTIQQIINSFDNDPNARPFQDVGLDGLTDQMEQQHFNETYLELLRNQFGETSMAYQNALQDPSADNFHYFRGSDYDEQDVKIIERYKQYNNQQGNSPAHTQTNESYLAAETTQPDVEDVNNDNTLSEEEKYYQYVIELRPDRMNVGENYINDIYEGVPERLPNGTSPITKWYQFRIPIKNPDQVVGNISGFHSIRFMRVFMREFEEPIICRLATFELVKSNWRTYTHELYEDGDYVPGGDVNTVVNVGTVNFEENANRVPIPYVLPPGIQREKISGLVVYQQNEQSLSMKIAELADGDARAVYKNANFDMRQFKKLEMFIHAEDLYTSGDLRPGDITVFIRLGSDFTENYYEYEIPIEITPWGVGKDSTLIWPVKNRMAIVLDSIVDIKQLRNKAVREGHHINNATPYVHHLENGNRVTILGMPNLASVNTIMLGVRNPKKRSLNDGDDMLPKSVEIWFNELRLVGFDDRSGMAALGRVRMNLADLGDLTLSSTYSTPGFGSLEQAVTDRQIATKYSVDVATNLDGGKVLFPQKWNIKVPFHYDFSQVGELPEYNPLNPDVLLIEDLATFDNADERDSVRAMTTVLVQRQNLNITNVRKERDLNKPLKIRPWDIENLDFSYAYSEVAKRDVDVEFDNETRHEGQIGYTYTSTPKNYRPFSRVKFLKSSWLQIIRDVNINPLPKNVTFRTTVTRESNEFKLRPKSKGNIIIDTSIVKNFMWVRDYSVQWDLTQALRLNYKALSTSRIDEPPGLLDTREKKDSVWLSFRTGGRSTQFMQRIDGSWQVPLNKIPLFKWINTNLTYNATYNFTASPLSLANLGNTIDNSNQMQANVNFNLVTLYDLIPYLKKVNQGSQRRPQSPAGRAGGRREDNPKNENQTKDTVKVNVGKLILDHSLRFLMMVRNVSFNVSQGNGTTLPGYMYSPNLFGASLVNGSPGALFILGGQPDIQRMAVEGGWLTKDTLLNTPFLQRKNQTINVRANVEPFNNFRIDVTANRVYTQSFTEYFRADSEGVMHHYSPMTSGTFTISSIGLATFFRDPDKIFQEFRDLRKMMAERISSHNPNYTGEVDPETGFPIGYSGVNKEVLTAAFLATYGGQNSAKLDVTSPFPKIPMPNWRLNYNGLTRNKFFAKYFQNFSLSHSYTNTYTVGNFSTNINYEEDAQGNPTAVDPLGNFIAKRDFQQIAINEQFGPFIGFDMTLKNSLMLKVEYKKGRNVSMSFANNQITEVNTNEISISSGYRFKDLKLGFVFSGEKRQTVSDLNVTVGFALRDNMTVLRKIEENQNQISAGMLTVTINISADYQISQMVGLRYYYNQVINRPKTSLTNNNMNLETGFSVRLLLAQ